MCSRTTTSSRCRAASAIRIARERSSRASRTRRRRCVVCASNRSRKRRRGAIADAVYADNRILGVRRVLGLCGLAKKHGVIAVERAAKVALDAGALTYRAVKACLVHHQATPLALRQVDPLIRGLTEYRDLV